MSDAAKIKSNRKKIADLKKQLNNERMSKGKRDGIVKQLRSLIAANRRIDAKIEAGIEKSMNKDEVKMDKGGKEMERRDKIKDRRQRQRANAKQRKAEASARKNNPVAKRQLPARRQLPAVRSKSSVVPWRAGKTLLGKLFTRLGVPAAIASLGYQAYSKKKEVDAKVDASVAQYEKQARKIAKESAALKAPPKRGNNLFLAGEKVNVNKAAMKALEKREVKPRAMDKPAKAKEPKSDRKTVKELSFGQAFAAARKAGKKTFMFKGEPFHTRTAEEEAKNEKKAVRRRKMKVGKPGYNRRTVR